MLRAMSLARVRRNIAALVDAHALSSEVEAEAVGSAHPPVMVAVAVVAVSVVVVLVVLVVTFLVFLPRLGAFVVRLLR